MTRMLEPARRLRRREGDERVLVLAPRGRNAELIHRTLERAGIGSVICADVNELCDRMGEPAGAVIVCEEAFTRSSLECLVAALGRQPPWSEVPLLVMTGSGRTTRSSLHIAAALGPRGNVTLMERPVRILTLVSAVRAALRARRRQYELRDLLASEHAARAQAEAANRAKDQFLALLSHELRTPLNPVLMTLSARLEEPDLPEGLRADLDLVKRNIELESRLIDDLLDLTRIARGKLELHHEAVDFHALVRHAIATCSEGGDARRKRPAIVTDLRADHPYVWGDAARLSQVLWNLIKNAIKFTPDRGTITIRTHNAGDGSLVASVSDTGIGIERDALGRIFDAFEQADRGITRRFGGLGLGLAISKALVALHGGTISVHSDGPGTGATFTIRLGTVQEPRRGAGADKQAGGRRRRRRHDGLAVLLVEDHDSTAEVMVRLLRAMDLRVVVARDLATARQRLETETFDLIISDLGLPDGTGLDLIRQVRRSSRVPAIAISGYGMEDDLRQSCDAGFDVHLVKPIDVPKLHAAISRVIPGGGT